MSSVRDSYRSRDYHRKPGSLQRRSGLQVPEILIEASANIVVKAESVRAIAIRRPPVAGGLPLLL
jgi:hypothetical protein